MNSAIKPLGASPQNSTVGSQVNKTMHTQASTASYSQPSHVPQSLVNMHTNTNAAHNHPNQQHHYPLNVPNTSSHYMNQNMGQIPASNHPVANPSSTAAGQGYNQQKNQNSFPPVSQTLPASVPQQQNSNATLQGTEAQVDTPHSNGTPEVQSPQKIENQSSFSLIPKEKVAQPPPVPQVTLLQEKSEKAAPDKEQPQPKSAETAETAESNVLTPNSKPILSKSSAINQSDSPGIAMKTSESTKAATSVLSKDQKSSDAEIKKVELMEKSPSPQAENLDKGKLSESGKGAKTDEPKSPKKTESVPASEEKIYSKPQEQGSAKNEQSPLKQTPSSSLTVTPVTKTLVRKVKAQNPKSEESLKYLKEPKIPLQKSPNAGKAKRQRIKTQPYQSPLPEVELISKISSSAHKNNDEKLIVFYKNEFLAVRNAEGSFYLCQAVQNIYKSSSKIKIRWLSQDKNEKSGEIYTPDFYDLTDFDCILTNLSLSRIEKGKYRLPSSEKERTQSILNRSLAVEKGEVTSPSLTEEHPDGLDLSLYKDEDQLKKRKGRKRKSGRKPSLSKSSVTSEVLVMKTPEAPKVRKTIQPIKAVVKKPTPVKTPVPPKKARAPTQSEPKKSPPSIGRSTVRSKRKADVKSSPSVDQKKAKVLAKIGRKVIAPAPKPSPSSTKSTKLGTKAVATSSKKAVTKKSTSVSSVKYPPTRNAKRSSRK